MICFCSNTNYGVEECENNLHKQSYSRQASLVLSIMNTLLFWVQAKTYITTQNPLCPRDASANLTVAGLQYGDPFAGEHIEHVPYTEPCKHTQHHTLFLQREQQQTVFQTMPLSRSDSRD